MGDQSQFDTEVHASPQDAPWLYEPGMSFWRPSAFQTFRMLGWQWLMVFPVLGLLALTCVCFYFNVWVDAFRYGFKFVLVAYGAAVGAALTAFKNALKARTDPFCIRCGYTLHGLPDGHRCPECGLPISLAIIREYQRDPENFISRLKKPQVDVAPGPTLEVPAGARRRKTRDGT